MLWIILGLGSAFFDSLKQALSKKTLGKYNPYVVAWYSAIISFLILLPINLYYGFVPLSSDFFVYLLIVGGINTFTAVLIMKALQETDLSLVSPLFSFSPALVLITAIFILDEIPNFFGTLGVLFIVIGSIVLNVKKGTNPFSNFLHNRGERYILLATLLWSISSGFYKLGIQSTSAFIFVMCVHGFITLALFPFFLKYRTRPTRSLVAIGITGGLVSIFQWVAASITMVTYAMSLKRVSSIISIFFGKKYFHEKNIGWKYAGAVIMLFGVGLIVVLG